MVHGYGHVRRVLDMFEEYAAGGVDAEGLRRNVAAVMGAIEGDVPRTVRDAIERAEGQLDSIRLAVAPSAERAAVDEVRREIEAAIARSGGWPPRHQAAEGDSDTA